MAGIPKHGHAWPKRSPTYVSWEEMLRRCFNTKTPGYRWYGARGISVCARWRSDFQAFLTDMGPRPPGTSIDRIDNAGQYEPGNCRWATPAEQNRNMRSNVWLTHNGERLCLRDWATRIGVSYMTMKQRLAYGWTVAEAVTTPPMQCGRRVRKPPCQAL